MTSPHSSQSLDFHRMTSCSQTPNIPSTGTRDGDLHDEVTGSHALPACRLAAYLLLGFLMAALKRIKHLPRTHMSSNRVRVCRWISPSGPNVDDMACRTAKLAHLLSQPAVTAFNHEPDPIALLWHKYPCCAMWATRKSRDWIDWLPEVPKFNLPASCSKSIRVEWRWT